MTRAKNSVWLAIDRLRLSVSRMETCGCVLVVACLLPCKGQFKIAEIWLRFYIRFQFDWAQSYRFLT